MMLEKLRRLELPQPIAVVGMGASGKAALKVLLDAGYDARGVDEKPQDGCVQASLDDAQALADFKTAVISPGIDRRKPAVAHFSGLAVNDVEIFGRLCEKPVAAITGSNGKSTAVTMLAEVLAGAGLNVRLCGNIGRPVLEALFDAPQETDAYVLELSSYQLEICPSLAIDAGCVLNVTPDHLDRYEDFSGYADAKANLVRQSQVCVLNGQDAVCESMAALARQPVFFGIGTENHVEDGQIYMDNTPVLATRELSVHGRHNEENALAVLLLARALGVPLEDALPALRLFRGLPHRMRLVSEEGGVRWLDDSKATNIGAAAAALAGADAPVWLIAGGLGKGQDFSELAQVILNTPVKQVLLIGKDNHSMEKAFSDAGVDFVVLGEMHKAVAYAREHAQAGDWVLLSPAAASFDQFRSYAERGDCFAYEVNSTCR